LIDSYWGSCWDVIIGIFQWKFQWEFQ
jgi:hypothetical protein